jgi:hypothetical protein
MIREYAEEHYYCESWDLVARQWSNTEIAAAITGAKTRRGAIAKAWGKLQVIDRSRPDYERPVKPVSLLEFLASCGGLRSDDRLITEVRGSIGGNVLVPRFGPLVREPRQLSTAARMGGHKAPMFLDMAREAAVSAGYLQDTAWEGGVSTSTISDLLNAIDDEARGRKVYPHGELPFEPNDMDDNREEATDDCPF